MASAVLSSVADGESEIVGAEAVQKSYPTFFEDFMCSLRPCGAQLRLYYTILIINASVFNNFFKNFLFFLKF